MKERKIATPNDLAAYLKSARKSAKQSQLDIAKISGIRQATISSIENVTSPRPIYNLLRLLNALNLELVIREKSERSEKQQNKDQW